MVDVKNQKKYMSNFYIILNLFLSLALIENVISFFKFIIHKRQCDFSFSKILSQTGFLKFETICFKRIEIFCLLYFSINIYFILQGKLFNIIDELKTFRLLILVD